MKKRHAFAALTVMTAPFAVVPTAGAAPAPNQATVISHVTIDKNDPSVGYVRARYTCDSKVDHLWVSVKQDATGSRNPDLLKEGSGFGGTATTWVQAHPGSLQCDGKNRVQVFQVDTTELAPPEFGGQPIGRGALIRGSGYVQFCLTSSSDPTFLVADMNFQEVK